MNRRMLGIGILLFLIDRGVKQWTFERGPEVDLIPGWLRIELTWNEGIAFSLPFTGGAAVLVILLLMAGVAFSIFFFLRKRKFVAATASMWIFLGALSNAWDRLQWGAILDYIRIWKFSVVNLADLLILGGVGFFIFFYVSDETLSKTH